MKRVGFTIIELITVVAIIAVVTVSSVISFTSLTGRRLDTDTRKVSNDLCWARQMAAAAHLDYIIDFDLVNNGYVIYRDVNGNGLPEVTEEVERRRLIVTIVSLTDLLGVPIAPARLTFNFPDGLSQDRLINFSYSAGTKQIRVFANTGYVKIQ